MQTTKTIPLDEHSWIFQEEGVRFFLLEGTDRALLIDSGMMEHHALGLAQAVCSKPIELLNTHADGDHLGSNPEFSSFYMNLAEAFNYYNHFHGSGEIIPVKGGDSIDLGGRILEIIDLPGHTPGSIAVLDCESGRLFSGDPIQKNGEIFMFEERREMHSYIISLKQLEERASEIREIYPSHGDCPLGPEAISICRQEAENILLGKYQGKPERFFDKHDIVVFDTGYTRFLCEK